MPIYQAFNPRINSWVKYEFSNKGFRVIDVKEKMPLIPFADIPIKGRRKTE